MTDSQAIDWHKDIFDVLNEQGVSLVAHVPDAGHTPLIKRCEAANDIDVVTLTTEEEGIGLLAAPGPAVAKACCSCNRAA